MGLSPKQISEIDARYKPSNFESDANRLQKFYDSSARQTTLEHLRALGMGDKKNKDPALVGIIPTLIRKLSVLYSSPPFRLLADKTTKEPLGNDDPGTEALVELESRLQLDALWARIDEARILFRTVVVKWAESLELKTVVARIFGPQFVLRAPDPSNADILDLDKAIALRVGGPDDEKEKQIFEVYEPAAGGWKVSRQLWSGVLDGAQPYPDSAGVIPYRGLPLQLVTDAPLMGRAYFPIPLHRLTAALAVDAVLNDVIFTAKQQAHDQTVIKTNNPSGVPSARGPDKEIIVPEGSDVENLSRNPKIEETGLIVDRLLSLLALAEDLPPDAFDPDRVSAQTGQALRIAERDLDRRRRKAAQTALGDERAAMEKIDSILTTYGDALELERLPEGKRLYVFYSPAWQPTDLVQQQQLSMRELAIGAKSLREHTAEMRGCNVADAGILLRAIEADLEEFAPKENPAALTDNAGARNPLGEGSATPIDPANISGSTEGASVVSAVKKRLG